MNVREVVRFALIGLWTNKLRSFLTTLGITIGVAAVVLLTAFGQGVSVDIQDQFAALGTNTLTVFPDPGDPDDTDLRSQRRDLTVADAQALQRSDIAPAVAIASPVVARSFLLRSGDLSYRVAQFLGTDVQYVEATDGVIVSGRTFSADDVARARKVVVLGDTVVDELFGGSDPVGSRITVEGVPFQVIGVLEEKGLLGDVDPDDLAVAPLSTVQQSLVGFGPLSSITVAAPSSDLVDDAEAQVRAILDERHDIRDPDQRDYDIFNAAALLDTIAAITDSFTVLLATIAAISLLVGGIGITNIMLVTVTERTREIGIRKAIGASRGAILAQFLAEATLLSLLGGTLGVLLGVAGSQVEVAGIDPVVVPAAIVLAFVVSVAIGLFFGVYPARRAASLRPIDALRYE